MRWESCAIPPADSYSIVCLRHRVTVVLYVSCLPPEDRHYIPPNEIAFYIFGMVSCCDAVRGLRRLSSFLVSVHGLLSPYLTFAVAAVAAIAVIVPCETACA